jgi:hypothetical protein
MTAVIVSAARLGGAGRRLVPRPSMLAAPTHHLFAWAAWLADPTPAPTGIPNPGFGSAPPGSAGIVTILGWIAWGVSAACIGGILFQAIKMAISIRRGEFSEHAMGLGIVLFACIVGASAFGVVGAVMTSASH